MSLATINNSRFQLSSSQAYELVKQFGSPLYVADETHIRPRASEFVKCWPGDVSFASKANTTLALLKLIHSEGCSIDVASEGELRGALKAGIPAKDCRFHGNNKSYEELEFAVDVGVGKIIVDCFEEIERLKNFKNIPPLLLRLAPGVDPKTHAKISTGQADTKFGFAMDQGLAALKMCLDANFPIIGFHCHVGSQLLDPEAQMEGARALVTFALDMKAKLGFETKFINIGGGLGVRYSMQDQPMAIADYCRSVLQILQPIKDSLPNVEFGMEPGRSIVAESAVTLYQIGSVKTAANGRVYVAVDGGLSDNPRPALYGSKYDLVWHVTRPSNESKTVTVSGKHCETDTLFPDVVAPDSVSAGDILEVLCTGAYNSSMASNYNGLRRPATVLIRPSGKADLIQRRETYEEIHQRELIPEDM